MLTSQQADEFANRGFVLIPQVVPGDLVNRANARVDELIAADPPADGTRGNHFCFPGAAGEPALLAPLTGTPAFGLAGELAGPGILEVPDQVHAAYFRAQGPEQFCAYPPVPLPALEQVTGRAGDLLLAHYLLGHNIGGNFGSSQVRRALYFRVSARGHASRRSAFLQDPWLDYPAVRARNGQPPA